MIYCTYNPDNYYGHRVERFEAANWEEAEQRAHKFLEQLLGKGRWEYQITQVTEGSSYRIYNNLTHERE
jgi:hypothetical protein